MLHLKLAFLGLVAVGTLGAAYVQSRPGRLRVVREANMAVSADKILPHICNFTNWKAWSPWVERDPNMQIDISQPPDVVGATYVWKGNKEVGEGQMTLLAVTANSATIGLKFVKPFPGENTVKFTLIPQGDGTLVQWEMEGPQIFISKLVGLFLDMDKMIGKDFEKGLASLKKVVAG